MRIRFWVVVLMLLVAACSGETSETTTGSTTQPPTDTTTTMAPGTTTTVPETSTTAAPGLDLSADGWVLHTIDGIVDETGTLLFDSDPFLGEPNLARDHAGGLVFTDTFGLWWWQAGGTQPGLVLDGAGFSIIEVIPTGSGPVVRLAGDPERYVGLETLTEVAPVPGSVEITEDFAQIRHATNGLTATVTQPEVTLTTEGFPDEVIEPAHLIVARNGETLLDVRIGGPVEAYARLHDFDGQRLIVSRGPYEPALPPEMYMVIDLACPECTEVFYEAAATATLTGPDADWDGVAAGPAAICSAWNPTFTGAPGAGLTTAAEDSRSDLLRAAAACDLTGLRYELATGADVIITHVAFSIMDPAAWMEVAPDVLGSIDAALRQPWRESEVDGQAAYVFPAWYAVDGWDELTGAEQAAMTAWYGDSAADFWSDYFSIARDDDISVTISGSGEVIRLERPLS